jgi:nicotinamidase-related amidase
LKKFEVPLREKFSSTADLRGQKIMTTALLIIDVQRALCSGEYEVLESRRVIDRINQVTQGFRQARGLVVVIQHEEPGSPMAHGAEGWKLDPELQVEPDDVYIRKTTPDSFHNTELLAVLQARGANKLVVCGVQSEFCVDSTMRRALALGFPVTLVADGHSTMDNSVLSAGQIVAHQNDTLSKMNSFGPRVLVVPASEVQFEV